ncbi:hypothetical protein P3T76_004702 [Phytophthora citrophthora]|uniref:Uncharacterized protein n=1 Tax=Phytophthora citrophthora TaxID=4793 RepID=A0AAD9GSD1_9STRA|nr:hypothetical protein P3T76_004702 [Phytophthora citrophthora]
MVVFTSPTDPLRLSWRYRHTYYLPPWTLEELQLAASVLDYPFSDDKIENRFWKFGGVARNCFMLDPGRLPCELDELTKPTEVITCREALDKLLVGVPMDDRHRYFLHYEPKGDGRQWDTKLVSAMVREKLAKRLFSIIKGRMNQAQDLLLGIPDGESLRRSILEVRVHTKLQRGRPLIARRLDVATERGTRFKIVKSAEMDIFQSNELTTALLNNGPYHKLKQNNFLSMDGFYFPVLPVGETPSLDEKDKRILLFRIADSTTLPVRASGIIYLLKKLGLLDMVKANPKHAAQIFFHPAVGLKDFNRQQILSNGICTSPKRVDEVEGIGSGTLKTLRTYNVKKIADLEEKIDDFQNGNLTLEDEKDRENWLRPVRLWEQEVQCLDDPANVKMVDEIPQYVASSGKAQLYDVGAA